MNIPSSRRRSPHRGRAAMGTTVPLSKLALAWLAGLAGRRRFGLAAAVLLAVAAGRSAGGAARGVHAGADRPGAGLRRFGRGAERWHRADQRHPRRAADRGGAGDGRVIAAVWHRAVAPPVAWAGFVVSLAASAWSPSAAVGGATLAGDGLVVVSLFLSAAVTVAQGRLLAGRDPVAVTAVQFLGATVGALAVRRRHRGRRRAGQRGCGAGGGRAGRRRDAGAVHPVRLRAEPGVGRGGRGLPQPRAAGRRHRGRGRVRRPGRPRADRRGPGHRGRHRAEQPAADHRPPGRRGCRRSASRCWRRRCWRRSAVRRREAPGRWTRRRCAGCRTGLGGELRADARRESQRTATDALRRASPGATAVVRWSGVMSRFRRPHAGPWRLTERRGPPGGCGTAGGGPACADGGRPRGEATPRAARRARDVYCRWRASKGQVGGRQAVGRGPDLVPVGVQQRQGAGLVQLGPLAVAERRGRRRPGCRPVLVGARADHQRGDGRPGQEPGQRHLGGRDAVTTGDVDQHLDRCRTAVLVVDGRLVPVRELPAPGRGLVRRGGTCRTAGRPQAGSRPARPGPGRWSAGSARTRRRGPAGSSRSAG